MNFKVFLIIFAFIIALLVSVSVAVKSHIDTSIQKGVESELALQSLQRQNEAVRENALHKEQIVKHNATQQQRFEALNTKYSKILSQNKSCESELKAVKELLGVFYAK